jgi:hypothetical protein
VHTNTRLDKQEAKETNPKYSGTNNHSSNLFKMKRVCSRLCTILFPVSIVNNFRLSEESQLQLVWLVLTEAYRGTRRSLV